MARPQRNNVDYFPHPCDHGSRMHYLESKYGNDGYATWFKIIERLGKSDYHYLDLSDEVQLMFLSSLCRISEDTLNEIIQTLSKLNWCDRSLWEEKRIVFSQEFIDSVADAYKKRSNEVISINQLKDSLGIPYDGLSEPKPIKGKVKDTFNPKEKKRIVKDTTTTNSSIDSDPLNTQITMSQNGMRLLRPIEAVIEIRKDDTFIDSFMNGSPPAKFIRALLTEPANGKSRFERHCIQSGEELRSLKMYKMHLTNWGRKIYNELSPSAKTKFTT